MQGVETASPHTRAVADTEGGSSAETAPAKPSRPGPSETPKSSSALEAQQPRLPLEVPLLETAAVSSSGNIIGSHKAHRPESEKSDGGKEELESSADKALPLR